jgi:hypothetical protein
VNAIYRYEVPVDDEWHEFDLTGDVLHVAARQVDTVEFWSLNEPDQLAETCRFRVVGTGHLVDPNWVHRGTAIAPGGMLVWHLMQENPLWRALVDGLVLTDRAAESEATT